MQRYAVTVLAVAFSLLAAGCVTSPPASEHSGKIQPGPCIGREPAAANATDEGAPPLDACALEARIHELVNIERERNNLTPVAWDAALSSIAREYSMDMASRTYFSHFSPEGHSFSDRYAEANYTCSVSDGGYVYMGGENLFRNGLYSTVTLTESIGIVTSKAYEWKSMEAIASSTVRGWMESPGHRKNILEPHWTSEGIGISVASDYAVYITENFC